jgi:hypothetical protein
LNYYFTSYTNPKLVLQTFYHQDIMQYTSKLALLAVALFGTTALAAPFGGEAGYDVEAREVENDLSAREFYELYLEARADPSLDARELEYMDLEAREYHDYLVARDAASVPPSSPNTPSSSNIAVEAVKASESASGSLTRSPDGTVTETASTTSSYEVDDVIANSFTPPSKHNSTSDPSEHHKHHHRFLTAHQKAMRAARKAAAKKLQDPEVYKAALHHKHNKLHAFAVIKYLSDPKNFKRVIHNRKSRYYKAAKRLQRHRKAKAYLKSKKNFTTALEDVDHKYHRAAVKKYFAQDRANFENALKDPESRFYKAAVYAYLLEPKTRSEAKADAKSPFHEAALHFHKHHHHHHKHHHYHHEHEDASVSESMGGHHNATDSQVPQSSSSSSSQHA